MRPLAGMLLVGLTCGFTLAASDETTPVAVEFYDVAGMRAHQIVKDLDRLGPIGEDGVRYHANTQWRVGVTYELRPVDDGCEVSSLQTKLEVSMTLPRWIRPKRASSRLAAQWERYIIALRLHEDGHRDIGVAAAAKIERLATGWRSSEGCDSLTDQVKAAAEAVIAEHSQRDVRYDEETQHGRTQGAHFP